MNMGQRKKSPCEEWNLRPLDSMLRCSTTEPQRLNGEQGLLWSVKSKGLRFNSSWGLRIFLCPTLVTRQKTSFFISLPSSKLIISLISI